MTKFKPSERKVIEGIEEEMSGKLCPVCLQINIFKY